MNIKKIPALLLCISFLMLMFAGCGDREVEELPFEPDADIVEDLSETDASDNDSDNIPADGIDFSAAMATFPPDTIMIKSNDLTITWGELYAFLFRVVTNLMHSYGMELDFSEDSGDGSSLADLILEYSTEEALSFMTYEYGAKAIGLTLSDDDFEMYNEDINGLIALYGSIEELEDSLRENSGIYNFEIFEKLFRTEFLVGLLVVELYGEDTLSFPDESVDEYASQNEYMMALHILRMKTEDGDDTSFEEIEDILAQLHEQVNSEDFEDFFKELMHEKSEDPGGLMTFPDGYLFQHSDMVTPFSDACAELEIGQLSGIVETVFGYHIILRIPLDYDAIPIAVANEGASRSLRQLAAFNDFALLQREWRDSLEVNLEFSSEYLSIDLETIFKR